MPAVTEFRIPCASFEKVALSVSSACEEVEKSFSILVVKSNADVSVVKLR